MKCLNNFLRAYPILILFAIVAIVIVNHSYISSMYVYLDNSNSTLRDLGIHNPAAAGGVQAKLHNSSPFKAIICQEDLQHIKAIQETNVDMTPSRRLVDILYRAMTKPVQGKFYRGLSYMGKLLIICQFHFILPNERP